MNTMQINFRKVQAEEAYIEAVKRNREMHKRK